MNRRLAPAAPAPEPPGSKRTEQLVEKALAKLGPSDLPPLHHVRRYAAVLAAAEAYTAFEQAAANTAFLAAHDAEGTQYGIDGRNDPAAARKAHHAAREHMNRLLPHVSNVRKALYELKQSYCCHSQHLPASLKGEYPEARLSNWFLELREFERYLKAGLTIEGRLPEKPQPASRFTVAQLCFLWWSVGTRYRGRWRHMSALAYAWGLHEWKKAEIQHPRVFERVVIRLRQQHPKIPSPVRLMPRPDRDLFLNP